MDSRDQFFSKLGAEYDGFIDDLHTKGADAIINSAYRKVCYDEIAAAFESSDYSERNYAALSAEDNLLASIFSAWLDTDTADFEQLPNVIERYAAREMGYTLEYADDDSPEWHDKADREEPGEPPDYLLESIASDSAEKSSVTAETINGAVTYDDWVIAVTEKAYSGLIGQVTAIDKLGTDAHDTDNPGDDVHVDFPAWTISRTRFWR
jgi:hypothetical protein